MLTIIGFIIIFFTSLLFGIILLKKDFVLGLIFLFGLILRIICSFAQDLYHIAPYDWDETAFFQMGLKMYEFFLGNTNSIPFENLTGVPTYGSFLGIIFYFFEPNTLLVRVINSLLGAIIIVLTYKLAREIDIERRSSLIVSCLVAFTPSYIIYSSLIMRDIIIWILLIIVVIQWVKTIQNNNYINFIIGLAFALILIPLRKQYILILALFAMFTLMIVWFRKDLKYANVKITAIKYLLIFCVLTITIIISYQLLIVEI